VLVHLFLLCSFQFLAPVVFKLPPRAAAFLPMVIFPAVLFLFMWITNTKSIEVLFDRNDKQVELVDSVVEATKDLALTRDYECRMFFITRFEKRIRELNLADMKACKRLVNNAQCTAWVTTMFVAGYTYAGGEEVIAGSLSLAMYLTNIAVFTQMGAAFGMILVICVQIQTAFPALLRITRLLNLTSDHFTLMGWTRFQADTGIEQAGVRAAPGHSGFDLLPIWIRDLKLVHSHLADTVDSSGIKLHTSGGDESCFRFNGSLELKQGHLISLIGPHSGGKSTLLRVLGGTILPHPDMVCAGQLFVPGHLRLVHVPSESMFFRGTLWENLTFGLLQAGDEGDGSRTRVESILRLLDLPDNVVNMLDDGHIHGNHWLETICLSQRCLLSIARALIANPEVICVHKPTDKFSEIEGKRVLEVLKMFVEQKGLAKGPPTIRTRPRTCIMTNVNLFAKDYADDIIHVSREGIRRLDKGARDSLASRDFKE